MDEDLREKLASVIRKPCDSCGRPILVEVCFSREEGFLRLWQEGICPGCGYKVFVTMPEVVLVLDESARRLLSN